MSTSAHRAGGRDCRSVPRANLTGAVDQVFPEHVTQKLKHGEAVISEAHDCVTVRCLPPPPFFIRSLCFGPVLSLSPIPPCLFDLVFVHGPLQVLFSDIVGYTSMSTSVNTADVFDMLNKLYTAFDALSDKHGVYKVDTIGDGQLPSPLHLIDHLKAQPMRIVPHAFTLSCPHTFLRTPPFPMVYVVPHGGRPGSAAYMVAAGHEESSKLDHHIRVFAMAKVPPPGSLNRDPMPQIRTPLAAHTPGSVPPFLITFWPIPSGRSESATPLMTAHRHPTFDDASGTAFAESLTRTS
jgi:hypothetical protein